MSWQIAVVIIGFLGVLTASAFDFADHLIVSVLGLGIGYGIKKLISWLWKRYR